VSNVIVYIYMPRYLEVSRYLGVSVYVAMLNI
jgi:hypothetical protein